MRTNNTLNRLLKPSRPRLWLGELRDMVQRTQTYYALFNAALLLVTAYTVREVTIKTYAPWLSLPLFFALLVALMLGVMYLDRKLVYPSQVMFHQHLAWKSESPVKKQLDRIERKNDMRLTRIEEALGLEPYKEEADDVNNGQVPPEVPRPDVLEE